MSGGALTLDKLSGDGTQSYEAWLGHFHAWCIFYELVEAKMKYAFPFHLEKPAKVWFDNDSDHETWDGLKQAFVARFKADTELLDGSLFDTKQGQSEKVIDYLTRLHYVMSNRKLSDELKLAVALSGLKPEIKSVVANKEPKSLDDLLHISILAEKTMIVTNSSVNAAQSDIPTKLLLARITSLEGMVEKSLCIAEPHQQSPRHYPSHLFKNHILLIILNPNLAFRCHFHPVTTTHTLPKPHFNTVIATCMIHNMFIDQASVIFQEKSTSLNKTMQDINQLIPDSSMLANRTKNTSTTPFRW
ncbi:uncharacterized protein LOC110456567 [Mizuhopecten yessoensis]|uniref:uncharacterized protein LOC110456567 n=1 Tax=Mizuhopecten yessoensis TaxID=6573 RepID=UPI000B45EE6A|nr:uncharacterized protein LOC110456567 [Mizuhopecten yessoensis]